MTVGTGQGPTGVFACWLPVDPASVSVIHLTRYGPRIVRVNDNGPLKLEPEKEEEPPQEARGPAAAAEPEKVAQEAA